MNKSLIALAASLLLTALPTVSQAEEASPLSFNVSLTSDYRYRGISQTRVKPALQGGMDFAGPNGLYLGTWASTIKWVKDGGGDANVEIDVYGGWKGEVSKDLTLDVGVLTYVYPSNKLSPSANTTEIYGALSYGPATLKYSHSVTNLFGFPDSKNSGYLDLSASFDLGDGLMLAPHVGYQKVSHLSAASYTDYSLTLSKTFGIWTPSIAVVGTDTDVYVSPVNNKDLGKAGLVLAIKAAF
ncbi:TorF family putative porin [Ideonella sp. 4Y16]|uniref:TorF family putative porin n=1 Tax=Ideonella alba TaxID=2824118 RepID=A0A941BCH2_9BURK|nr:TorF family putative porin [Ideonella alba]MBQ0929146.1 TorF family putative porin [Ideonella alba]MBQ0943092.1 TorF family putative porin [Ideonella alba]